MPACLSLMSLDEHLADWGLTRKWARRPTECSTGWLYLANRLMSHALDTLRRTPVYCLRGCPIPGHG